MPGLSTWQDYFHTLSKSINKKIQGNSDFLKIAIISDLEHISASKVVFKLPPNFSGHLER